MQLNLKQQEAFNTLIRYALDSDALIGNSTAVLEDDIDIFADSGNKEDVESVVHTPLNRFYLLEGFAGSGKSTVISRVVEECIKGHGRLKIAMTAPTNKAVKVLQEMSKFRDDITFSTIHSLCALKEVIDTRTGKRSYEPDKGSKKIPPIATVDLLIVDESSMLHSMLVKIIMDYAKQYNFNVIFVGDVNQLPPVGDTEFKTSQVFIPILQRKYDIGVLKFEEIVRQAMDNPIINYSTCIRIGITPDTYPVMKDTGVECITSNKDLMLSLLNKYFDTPAFKADSNYAKVLAFRNETVNAYNKVIREILYKQTNLPKVVTGERLIADTSILKEVDKKKMVLFSTSEELVVRKILRIHPCQIKYKLWETVEVICGSDSEILQYYDKMDPLEQSRANNPNIPYPKTIKIWDWVDYTETFNVYDVQVKSELSKYVEGKPQGDVDIQILHEDSELLFTTVCNKIKNNALNCKDYDVRRHIWTWYYGVLNVFANVKYNYAITIHKSQGSGYSYVFMNEWDINSSPTKDLIPKLKYVAATRAINKLFIVNK